MTVTLTSNYQETLNPPTVEKIEELLAENYFLGDMMEFIDEHNEEDFVSYYEEYVTSGESVGCDVTDKFIEEFGLDCVAFCEEAYQGEYNSPADFSKQFMCDMGYDIPEYIVVDWEQTWKQNLYYDFTYVDGYVFSKNF